MITITSTHNPRIRALRELRQAKARQESGCFLVEGAKLVGEAIRDARIGTILVDMERMERYQALLEGQRDVIAAPAHVVASVTETKAPQGILASARQPAPLDLDMARGALLVLDGVQDPGNVGAMIRTAESAGFMGALLSPACADVFSPKAVRATMGSILRVPVWRGALVQALGELRRKGYTVVCSALGGVGFYGAVETLRTPFALVVGSEGGGISHAVLETADIRAQLPMAGRAESLNAAVAAGIMMYRMMEGKWK